MKFRPASPSAKMAKLSKKLTKKISKTSILAELPFGSPPPHLPSTSLLQASYLEDQAALAEKKRVESRLQTTSQTVVDARASFSDDTTSTFSCTGDFLPDEGGSDKEFSSPPLDGTSDEDIEDIRRMAATISDRRGINVDSLMPRLLDLFSPAPSAEHTQTQQIDNHRLQRVATAPVASGTAVRKPSHIMGFINRLKPQLSLETSLETRRFSFEVGDDRGPIRATYPTSREILLRQSVSLSSLPNVAPHVTAATASIDLSPIESSPTSARTSDSRRTSSKIPSPTYNAPLARRRQERDDSTSSLLTAMKGSDHAGHRSNSAASSVYSSRSLSCLYNVNTEDTHAMSRAAPPPPIERSATRLELGRMHGISSADAAGIGNVRQLVENTKAARGGTSQGGGTVSIRDNGSADISNAPSPKTYSSTRAGAEGRSRSVQDNGVHPSRIATENVRPSKP